MKQSIQGFKTTVLIVVFISLMAVPWVRVPAAGAADGTTVSRQQQLARLEQTSETLYRSMQNGQVVEAQEAVESIAVQLGSVSYAGLTGVEGIHELAACVIDAKTLVYKANPDLEAWKKASARLQLAVNSLVHAKGAIWLQYYKVLSDDADELSKAALQNNLAATAKDYAELQEHYELIRPAAVIQREPSQIAAMDSWLSFIQSASGGGGNGADLAKLQTALAGGQELLNTLFGKAKDEPVLLPIAGYSNPWSWVFLIGVWILLALAYTGYRKYLAAQEVHPVTAPADKGADKRFW